MAFTAESFPTPTLLYYTIILLLCRGHGCVCLNNCVIQKESESEIQIGHFAGSVHRISLTADAGPQRSKLPIPPISLYLYCNAIRLELDYYHPT